MTTSRVRSFSLQAAVGGVLLAAFAQAGHALQPEPQILSENGTGAAAAVAGMMGGPAMVGAGFHGRAGHRDGPPPLLPPFIRLTSEQEDKLFELRHAQEPALRTQMKELRSAHAQLATLALAEAYDETRARQTVARVSQASGDLALMHARLQHAAYALLTPEQRKQLEQCRPGTDGAPSKECAGPPR